MVKLFKKRSKKAGLAPGTLVHIGEQKVEQVVISVLNYDDTQVQETICQSVDDCLTYKDTPAVTWIDVTGIHDTKVLKALGNMYEIHPLVLEDILDTTQRPKQELSDNSLYISLKMLYPDASNSTILVEQLSLVVGDTYMLSFQEQNNVLLDTIKKRIHKTKWRTRNPGTDYLAYALVDVVVDHYFNILEIMEERIRLLNHEVKTAPNSATLAKIDTLNQDILLLRKYIWPLREVIQALQKLETSLIKSDTKVYLRDLQDHIIQAVDMIEFFIGTLDSLDNRYLSTVNNQINSTMQFLTIMATIFMPLMFIVGVYGMNFKHMPELEWTLGYPTVWGIMLLIPVVMIIYFKKRKFI